METKLETTFCLGLSNDGKPHLTPKIKYSSRDLISLHAWGEYLMLEVGGGAEY